MIFPKSNFTLSLALLLLSSYVAADGCQDCGGFDKTSIYTQCVDQCNSALSNPSDAEACSDQCSKLVLEENCCTTTICPSARLLRRSSISEREILANVVYETVDTASRTNTEVERSIEARDGASCCAGCRALGYAGNLCPVNSLGFAISMASIACKLGCAKEWQTVC